MTAFAAPPDVLSSLTTALVATAGEGDVSVFPGFQPAWPGARAAGYAFTVRGVAGDNLALHRALAEAPRGAILVADVEDGNSHGHWGDLMTVAAQVRRIEALVIRGSIRDRDEIRARAFPVFHRGVSPRQAAKVAPGVLNPLLEWEGGSVASGDLVVADADGVIAVPASLVERVLAAAAEIERREAGIRDLLHGGQTTLEALGLLNSDEPPHNGQR